MRAFVLALAAAALCAVRGASAESASSDMVIVELNRAIDVSGQIARTTSTFTIENGGSDAQSAVYTIVESSKTVTYVTCEETESGDTLKVAPVRLDGVPDGYTAYKVALSSPLAAGEKIELLFYTAYVNSMTPLPAAIAQGEPQYVEYTDSLYLMTPYKVTEQSVEVVLASQSPPHYITEKEPSGIEAEIATFGPYEETQPFTFEELRLHVENNKPFFTIKNLVREYRVSHWGSLSVEDQYVDLTHTGAKLKGGWSRYEHTRAMNQYTNQDNVIRNIKQTIPANASGVYYNDDIGNISTSAVAETEDGLELELTPRFPLAGGWKVGFVAGYELDLAQYLSIGAEKYVLNVSFCPSIEHMLAEEYSLKVVLPEGATDIEVHAPFGLDSYEVKNRFSFLDSKGRPVVILSKKNIIEEHNENVQITYKFSTIVLLNEPLMMFVGFFCGFLVLIGLSRIDLTISATVAESTASAELSAAAAAVFSKNTLSFDKAQASLEERVPTKTVKAMVEGVKKKLVAESRELELKAKAVADFDYTPVREVLEAQGVLLDLMLANMKDPGSVDEEMQDKKESLSRLADVAGFEDV